VTLLLVRWINTTRSSHLFAIFGAERVRPIKKEDIFLILSEMATKYNVKIQLFNASLIAGWEHLYFSAIHAIMAFENGYNISKKLEMELLLYSIGRRQIKDAVNIMGISDDIQNLVCVIIAPDSVTIPELTSIKNKILTKIRCIENDVHFSVSNKKIQSIKQVFEISDTELSIVHKTLKKLDTSVTHCVLERLSLLPLSI